MADFFYRLVMFAADIHNNIMALNDGWGYYNNDKKLHFIVMGIVGMFILIVMYLIFKLLKDHLWVIAFIYTVTVMLVLTFAIEIGQGYYGTGLMEMEDVVAGMAGFLFLFIIFSLVRGIFMLIFNLIKGNDEKKRKMSGSR